MNSNITPQKLGVTKNQYSSGSINKAHLTPCRRVGLSRKVKNVKLLNGNEISPISSRLMQDNENDALSAILDDSSSNVDYIVDPSTLNEVTPNRNSAQLRRKLPMSKTTEDCEKSKSNDSFHCISPIKMSKVDKNSFKHSKTVTTTEESITDHSETELKQLLSEMQKALKTKQEELTYLRQVSVYKKLHNLEELTHVTSVWKEGCKESLQDLLHILQLPNEMSFQTILNRLKIPLDVLQDLHVDFFM